MIEHRRKDAVRHALRVLGIEHIADDHDIHWHLLADDMNRPALSEWLRAIYDGSGFAIVTDLFDVLDEVERGAILLALHMSFEGE